MTRKSNAIAAIIREFQGRERDAHYLGYFECFNRRLYYEAHDVLEELWLAQKAGPNGAFYKGLIQLAGAFVHLQKNRLRPAAALLKLSEENLGKYPVVHEGLDLRKVFELIQVSRMDLETSGFEKNPLVDGATPVLGLL